MEKSTKYKTLRVMNKPLFVWGLKPQQVAISFAIVAVLCLAFQVWGVLALIPVIIFAKWSRKETKAGNYNPLGTLQVKMKMPRNIIDNGDFYDSL